MGGTFLLFLIPVVFPSVKADSCIEIEKCEALSWLTTSKLNDTSEDVKKLFSCSDQDDQNTVKCPTPTDEQLSEEEIMRNSLQKKEANSTNDA